MTVWSTARRRATELAASRRGGLDILIVVTGVVATGLVSLVVDDLFPTSGRPTILVGRGVGAAAFLLILVSLLALRRALRRDFGTLYYVVGLSTSMADRHSERLQQESKAYQTYRIVRAPAPAPGTDEADHAANLADRLNDAMNQDDVATGFHLAPNMLWDVAMSVGSQIAGRSNASFVELDADLVRWAPQSTDGGAFADLEVRDRDGHADGAPVLVISLTTDLPTEPANWHLGEHRHLGVFTKGGDDPVPVRMASPPDGKTRLVHPWVCVEAVVGAICRMLHDHPDHPILVVARMPKTVALAVGIQLAVRARPLCEDPDCRQAGCLDPWSKLVPLRFDQGSRGIYEMVRVHPSQPAPERLAPFRTQRRGQPEGTPVRLVNLTPHDLVIYRDGQPLSTLPKAGDMARLQEVVRDLADLQTTAGELPHKAVSYTGALSDLPAPSPGTYIVVSRLTAQAVQRPDLLFPGGEVRDTANRIIGCEYLASMDGSVDA